MKVVHVTAHLGGGVGKAHASICAAGDPAIQHHFVLLEAPRDRRFADQLVATGAQVTIAQDLDEVMALADVADIVQIEWWNHPQIYRALCEKPFPAMRTILWAHISGVFAPLIPARLMGAGHRFLFTSACSLSLPAVSALSSETRSRLSVVNSGFGFERISETPAVLHHPRSIGYLGTLDFAKMSPAIFEVADRLGRDVPPIALWGAHDAEGAVATAHRAMRKPDRILFAGHASDPAAVLSGLGIFLYLLQPEHYGTAENALVEAMSLGLVPVAFANPAEKAIIRHGVTGFLEPDIDGVIHRLRDMLDNPGGLAEIGLAAMADVAATRTPGISAAAFAAIYHDVMGEAKTVPDFRAHLGETPAQWFLSTQVPERLDPASAAARIRLFSAQGSEAKGSLAHFRSAFPGDPSLQG